MIKNIGWIGTGVMGQSMAGHLIKKGSFKLNVFNRTQSKTDSLVAQGATFMPPIQIAKEADYLFLMLGYPHDVKNMVLHPDTGICRFMKKGAYLIDHTTSTPTLAKEIAENAS
jgi:3-hydroxyisobutyrate dehydrogenase